MGGIGDPSTNFYDANNRIVETWAPKVYTNGVAVRPITVNEFDDGGNIMATTDANGREVQMEYDAFGRLTHTVDAVGNTIGFEYDANGNQIALIDGNTNRTVFVYDGLNRKTSTIYPGGTHENAVYDLLGNRIERIDCNGAKTLYVYDSRNRLNDVTYQNGNVRDYEYDTVGNLTNVTETADANATVSYTYDELNRVSSETSVGVTQQYAYDLNGNRTNAVYGISGRSVAWEYDALNRITYIREGDHTTEYYYDLNSKPLWRVYPSKVWEARTFDGMGRLLTMDTHLTNGGTFGMAYEYDLVGSALQMEQTSSNLVGQAQNATTTWGYDDRYRLTNETVAIVGGTTSVSSYTWDAADNRLSMIKSVDGILASTTVYTNNALNQITGYVAEAPDLATTNVVYQYDANGSRTNKSVTVAGDGDPGVTSYTYDEDNRLIAVAGGGDPGNPTHHFKYDYRSRRYQRGTPTESTYHVFDGGLSIQEYDDPTLRISDAGISEYDTNQDGQNSQPTSATVVEGRQGIRLEGNAWKKVPLPVTLNSGSVLEFEVKIENVGEIIAIGVDDDNQHDNPRRLFQLAGWQVATNIEQDYTGVAVGSWIPVSIPIGQYFSGSFSHITFVADDDANGQAAVSFRNISVRADSDPLPYSTLRTEFIRGEGMGGGVGGMVYSIKRSEDPQPPTPNNELQTIICSHANHRGDVIARSDSVGSLTSFALYEAYGTRPYEWGDDPDRQKANTKEEETDLNLLNEGMRWRDLETGTFLTRDPLGYADGPNIYCYVRCNPITRFDAFGLYMSATTTVNDDGAKHTAFELTASIVFSEDSNLTPDQQAGAMESIQNGIQDGFTGGEGNHTWSMNTDISVAGSAADVPKGNHTIIVSATMPKGASSEALGAVKSLGDSTIHINSTKMEGGRGVGATAAHELGHSAGADHPDTIDKRTPNPDGTYGNLMHQSRYSGSKELTPSIVRGMQHNFDNGKMNKNLAPGPAPSKPSLWERITSALGQENTNMPVREDTEDPDEVLEDEDELDDEEEPDE